MAAISKRASIIKGGEHRAAYPGCLVTDSDPVCKNEWAFFMAEKVVN